MRIVRTSEACRLINPRRLLRNHDPQSRNAPNHSRHSAFPCGLPILFFVTLAGEAPPAQAPAPVVINSGYVSLYGHDLLPPPHVLQIDGSRLLLDGVQVYPQLRPPTGASLSPPTSLNSDATKLERAIFQDVLSHLASDSAANLSLPERRDLALRVFTTHSASIDSLDSTAADVINVKVHGALSWNALMLGPAPMPPPQQKATPEPTLRSMAGSLERGVILIIGTNGAQLSVPARYYDSLIAEIQEARTPSGLATWDSHAHILSAKYAALFASPLPFLPSQNR